MPKYKMISDYVLAAVSLTGCLANTGEAQAAKIEAGPSEQTAQLSVPLDIYTYRPFNCVPAGLLVVFHGVDRNADTYRDSAKPLADKLCLIVAAPSFDEQRFPNWRYQLGGIVWRHGLQDRANWTGNLVLQLIDWLRTQEGASAMPYYLLGHSAGAQFLSRMAAYVPSDAARIVIANPSTHVEASLTDAPPYGFYGLPSAEEVLKRYLASPITIFLGQEDHGSKNLATDPDAEDQGSTRFERGERAFHQAEDTAYQHGWPFGWQLVEVPGVGHSARSMFASPAAIQALTSKAP